ncbi:hypothetical protein LAZ67_14000430 [Cordylochernes scorpioides]|uniref:Uncharacterized protein n=1 Tax=Cordylochernes scorpioides TaxID=51811 RepID=A0ABY6L5L0_9ARAC|nr:hypothetical protein LAZ67_14000430 [Cordylochernes scorpioides]
MNEYFNFKQINPSRCLESQIYKQRLNYFGYIMREKGLEKILMLRKTEGRRKGRRPPMSWLEGVNETSTLRVRHINTGVWTTTNVPTTAHQHRVMDHNYVPTTAHQHRVMDHNYVPTTAHQHRGMDHNYVSTTAHQHRGMDHN